MKLLISAFVLLASVSAFAVPTTPPAPSKDVIIALADAFIPEGMTTNVSAYVVVSGTFPNSCYTWKTPQVTNPSTYLHEIRAIASVAQQQMCLMVMIPFQKSIELGKLAAGNHTLRFVSGDGTTFEKTMDVQ